MIRLEQARKEDAPFLARLVNDYAARKIMLYRTAESIAQAPGDWVVAAEYAAPTPDAARRILGGGSLTRLTPELAEVRSLVVDRADQNRGLGRRIVQSLIDMAQVRGYQQLCALTLSPLFFEKLGFRQVPMEQVSPKVWVDCVHCPKNQCCDEYAMIMDLVPDPYVPDYSHLNVTLPLKAKFHPEAELQCTAD